MKLKSKLSRLAQRLRVGRNVWKVRGQYVLFDFDGNTTALGSTKKESRASLVQMARPY